MRAWGRRKRRFFSFFRSLHLPNFNRKCQIITLQYYAVLYWFLSTQKCRNAWPSVSLIGHFALEFCLRTVCLGPACSGFETKMLENHLCSTHTLTAAKNVSQTLQCLCGYSLGSLDMERQMGDQCFIVCIHIRFQLLQIILLFWLCSVALLFTLKSHQVGLCSLSEVWGKGWRTWIVNGLHINVLLPRWSASFAELLVQYDNNQR